MRNFLRKLGRFFIKLSFLGESKKSKYSSVYTQDLFRLEVYWNKDIQMEDYPYLTLSRESEYKKEH